MIDNDKTDFLWCNRFSVFGRTLYSLMHENAISAIVQQRRSSSSVKSMSTVHFRWALAVVIFIYGTQWTHPKLWIVIIPFEMERRERQRSKGREREREWDREGERERDHKIALKNTNSFVAFNRIPLNMILLSSGNWSGETMLAPWRRRFRMASKTKLEENEKCSETSFDYIPKFQFSKLVWRMCRIAYDLG